MSPFYWTFGLSAGWHLTANRIWQKKFATLNDPWSIQTLQAKNEWEHLFFFKKPGTPDRVREQRLHQRGVWTTEGDPDKPLKNYPAAFPVSLPKMAILVYTEPGEIVLDPFCGSGTTLVAAKSLDRKGVGIEIEESACEIAKERIMSTTPGMRLE